MGLLRAEIVEILSLMAKYKEPRILMLGKQDVYVEQDDLKKLLLKYGYGSFELETCIINEGVIDSKRFFEMMGAVECHALDCSDYEGADIIFDLNSDVLPGNLEDRFDLIIDGGTLEHVFNPANAMKSICRMLKKRGTVYHMVPCAGLIDHGFFSFSPTFFIDYYEKNGFVIDTIRMQYKPERGIYKFVYYSMDCRLFLNPDGFNAYVRKCWDKGGEIMLQCVAIKESDDEIKGSPLQTRYRLIYGE